LLAGELAAMAHVTTFGKAARRTATAYFTVAGTPRAVAEHRPSAGERGDGHNYAWELTGARHPGPGCAAGLVHYNDRSDAERLLAGVASWVGHLDEGQRLDEAAAGQPDRPGRLAPGDEVAHQRHQPNGKTVSVVVASSSSVHHR
jgi:hypothetical protein